MKSRHLLLRIHLSRLVSAALLSSVAASAHAQFLDMSGLVAKNLALDGAFDSQLQSMMASNLAAQQQLMQSYSSQFGPQLEREYADYVQATGHAIPLEQYAYYHLMTAGGSNPGPALQQQQDSFRRLQDAHATQMSGYESYNRSWDQQQQSLGNSFERYTDGAIRGYARYQDPYSEEMHTLPYTPGPRYYSEGHETYYLDGSGDYYVVQPDGYHQFLNPYDDY